MILKADSGTFYLPFPNPHIFQEHFSASDQNTSGPSAAASIHPTTSHSRILFRNHRLISTAGGCYDGKRNENSFFFFDSEQKESEKPKQAVANHFCPSTFCAQTRRISIRFFVTVTTLGERVGRSTVWLHLVLSGSPCSLFLSLSHTFFFSLFPVSEPNSRVPSCQPC